MKIYVASSWRNTIQTDVVDFLRRSGHKVYDFKNPTVSYDQPPVGKGGGFSWSEIDKNWQNWTPEEYREALQHPLALMGYQFDINALKNCDACVLVLPSGRSASWEFGYAMGMGKRGAVFMLDKCEPELMYREAIIITSFQELEFYSDKDFLKNEGPSSAAWREKPSEVSGA